MFGVIFLSLYCYFKGHFRNTGLDKRSFALLALSGMFLVCNWIMLFASFKSASISTSTVIYHAQPFFFVIVAAIILRERLQTAKLAWMVPAFAGVVLVANISLDSISLSSDYVTGIFLALSAAVFWAISAALVKLIKNIKPYLVTLIQLTVGVVVLFPFASFDNVSLISNVQWMHLAILGAVHTCFVYILMYSSYQKLNTAIIAVLTFIYPAVAILVDFFVYKVMLSELQMLGVILIMFSSFAASMNIPLIPKLWKTKKP